MFRKSIFIGAVFALCAPASHAQYPVLKDDKDGWTVELGLGVEHEATFAGSNTQATEAAPLINATYKRGRNVLFTTGTDFGYYRMLSDKLRVGGSVGLEFGRDEEDDAALKGLGNIDDTEELRIDVLYSLTPDLTLGARAMTAGAGKDEVFFVGARYEFDTPSDRVELSITGDVSYATAKHLTTEFGVTETQAARSGYRVYRPGSGLKSVGLTLAGRYWFSKNWFGYGELSYEKFGGAGKDSPFVQQDDESEIGLGIGYRF